MSDTDWGETPSLHVYAGLEKADPHLWWRIACGHHENLFDAARDRIDELEAAGTALVTARAGTLHEQKAAIHAWNKLMEESTREEALL